VSFFDLPALRPPAEPRMPVWSRGPVDMVPGVVPVALLVARTGTHAVLVTDLRAYPTGLEFTLTGRPRPGQSDPQPHDPVIERHNRFAYRNLWLELRLADGRTASANPRRWPRTFETEQPDPPFLYSHGAGGSERGWRSPHWLWGLPPPGPLAFVCRWPADQDPVSGAEIDAGLVLEAADRATTVWPTR